MLKINSNGAYKGLQVYKYINSHIEERIEFYREQTKYNGDYKGEIIIEMLNNLEKALKLELD